MAVTGQRQLGLEFGFVEFLFDFEFKGVTRQKCGRRQTVQRRGRRHQHHVGALGLVALADAPQRSQAFTDQVLVRRERVVRQGFPVGEDGQTQFGRKKLDFFNQTLRIAGVGRHDGREPSLRFVAQGQLGQQHRVRRADRAGQGEAFTSDQGGKSHVQRQNKYPLAGCRGVSIIQIVPVILE